MLVHLSLCYSFFFYVKNLHQDFPKLNDLSLNSKMQMW